MDFDLPPEALPAVPIAPEPFSIDLFDEDDGVDLFSEDERKSAVFGCKKHLRARMIVRSLPGSR